MKKTLFVHTAVALAVAAPLLAHADSELVNGAGSAAANLDLRVVIPRVLFLGVGTGSGTPLATNAAVDSLTFDYSTNPLDVGTGNAAGSITNTGPSPAGASIPVRVFGNNGQVTITATNPAVLTSGTDTIPFTELSVASSNAAFAAPAFGGGTSLPTLAGRVTNQTADWTYSYANTTTPAFGTYEGRVTYTATMP
ncbi:MAG TPA: hypothetical protein VFY22_13875 [Hydrogenophaga sp.]|nr:hypothetical protein [Hydrogenophaga sp.]